MKKSLIILAVIASFSISSLSANTSNRQEIRCLKLIPELVEPIGVEFAIPDDFVAMSSNGKLDPTDWIYWGPKEVLQKYFQNPNSLDRSILRLKLSADVAKSSLNDDQYLKNSGLKIISSSQKQWGIYPLLSVEAKVKSKKIYTAWVGLHGTSDATIMFNLVHPKKQATQQDLDFWNHFLDKTSLLPEKQLFLALGQDMQPGFTLASCNAAWDTAKIKVVAERRKRDDKLQVGLIHISDNIDSECLGVTGGLKAGEWKVGEPLIKLSCAVTENVSENYTNHFLQTISVFEKPVEDFSFSKDDPEIAWFVE